MTPPNVIGLGTFVLFSLASLGAYGQASIAAENIIDTVVVQYVDATGSKQTQDVTLVRDARELMQWYYVPSSPVLVTTKFGNETIPQFSLLKYDYRDPDNNATIKRAGLLNFAVRLSLPPEAIGALRTAAAAEIAKKVGPVSAANIRLAALPINTATVSVFASDNKLVGTAEGTGTAPTFASQQMAFSVPLTELGVPVFDALVQTPTGIRTAIQYTYNGLTPPCGFTVSLNYKSARDYYSKNEKFAARASYYGLFSVSGSSESSTIRDTLVQAGAMKINVIDSATCTSARIDSYLQPILKRINDQVLLFMKPPAEISPAQAGTPSTGGYFGGAGYSVAVKTESQLKTLTEEIDFRQQTIVERATVASGFVGIANYPEGVKKQLFTAVDGTAFPSAYIAFPDVPRGVTRVDMTVELVARGELFGQKLYQYTRDHNWKDIAAGKDADRIGFSLAGVEQKFGKAGIGDAEFKITKVIRSAEDSTTVSDRARALEGASAVEIQSNVRALRLRPSQLVFRQMGGDLVRVEVTAKHGSKQKSYAFEAVNVNGTWQPPNDEFFFVPTSAGGDEVVALTVRSTYQDAGRNNAKEQKVTTATGFTDVYLDSMLK